MKKISSGLILNLSLIFISLLNLFFSVRLFMTFFVTSQTEQNKQFTAGLEELIILIGLLIFVLLALLFQYLSYRKTKTLTAHLPLNHRIPSLLLTLLPLVFFIILLLPSNKTASPQTYKPVQNTSPYHLFNCGKYTVHAENFRIQLKTDTGSEIILDDAGTAPAFSPDCGVLIYRSETLQLNKANIPVLIVFYPEKKLSKQIELTENSALFRSAFSTYGSYFELRFDRQDNYNKVDIYRLSDLKQVYSFQTGVYPYYWTDKHTLLHIFGEMSVHPKDSSYSIETTGVKLKNIATGAEKSFTPSNGLELYGPLGTAENKTYAYRMNFDPKTGSASNLHIFRVDDIKLKKIDEKDMVKIFPDYQKRIPDYDKIKAGKN